MYRLTELLLKPIRRTLHPNRTEESKVLAAYDAIEDEPAPETAE